jgi:SAM-dependent methyltransferase
MGSGQIECEGMSGGIKKAWRKWQWSLEQRGVWGTLRVVLERVLSRRRRGAVAQHPFDVEHGVETSGLIGGGELAIGVANDRYSTAYHGVPPSRMRDALERWRATSGTGATEDYTFVDIGCGKGRAMMMASEMPFREVVGVELNAGLLRVAEENLRRWRELGRMRCGVRVVQGDVTEVTLPDGPLLVYLYNPFHAPVLRALLQRIDGAAGDVRGCVDVLYLVPHQEAVFEEFARFERLWGEEIGTSEEDVVLDPVVSRGDRCNLYRR